MIIGVNIKYPGYKAVVMCHKSSVRFSPKCGGHPQQRSHSFVVLLPSDLLNELLKFKGVQKRKRSYADCVMEILEKVQTELWERVQSYNYVRVKFNRSNSIVIAVEEDTGPIISQRTT